ncbi:shikimate kinase [Planctomycetes bacterium K23_9]|uniref:Shikimate kinase n=1 Tax=Stieleria marina TaxID=1930275 RepID=A0A517NQ21_9BACT|nr:Shikimate kinase 2 [Planctomycetes bacterium K23_9]
MNQESHQHIYLTGYRGTGKSSVGRILAQRMTRTLVDLDDRIESAAGKTIREIFDDGGEAAFRDWETKCLELVVAEANEVVALGGGAILRQQNRQLIADSGLCVWLDADANTLAQRIFADESTADRRPSLTQLSPADEIRQMLDQRAPLYQEASHYRVDTGGKTPEEIAAEIIHLLST